jgi:hypothetical protein
MKTKLPIKTYKHFFPLLDNRENIIKDKLLPANFLKS